MNIVERWISALTETFHQIVMASAAYAPNIAGALILLLAGWGLARLLRAICERLGGRLEAAIAPLHGRVGIGVSELRWPFSRVVARIGFWIVILIFATAAASTLEVPGMTDGLSRLVRYIPIIFAAMVIIVIGYWLSGVVAGLTRTTAAAAGYAEADILGRMAGGLTLIIAIILGVEQLGFDVTLLTNLITIAVAALLAGIALAFGVGAGVSVGNIMAARHVAKLYQIGQRVRLNGVEGRILEINATSVILDTSEGRAAVPAKLFQEAVAVIIERESLADE